MDDSEQLADRFEAERGHLRAVAYRMLGSLPEADDAVQDAWVHLSRSGADDVQNLRAWLTTVVGRICLNMLRARRSRREEPFGVHLPDPIVRPVDKMQPEAEALLAESVGIALLVLLDTLTPAERLAFVLHDMFDLPFADIARVVGRTPTAARQLASRARRRVQGVDVQTREDDLGRQRAVVDAFFRATRAGDFDGLLAVLDPDVVLRADAGTWRPGLSVVVRGAEAVGRQYAVPIPNARLHPVVVNGAPGVVVTISGQPFALMAFTVAHGRIVEIDGIVEPERVLRLAGDAFAQA